MKYSLISMQKISSKCISLVIFSLVTLWTLYATILICDGHFVYTMDDPYIGLAVAERIASGHYGINITEISAPCSSIIYPFILSFGAGTSWHAFMPLVLNSLCGGLTVWLLGAIVDQCPWPLNDPLNFIKRLIVILLLIFSGNLVGLVFTGMEHSLQVLISVSCAYGLIEAWNERPIPLWCLIASALGPAVRYEMFAVVVAVNIALIGQYRWKAASFLTLTSLLLPLIFGFFLLKHGLPPLPNSVIAKTGAFIGGSNIFENLIINESFHAFFDLRTNAIRQFELGLIICMIAANWHMPAKKRWVLAGTVVMLIMHFSVGRFGWFHRYEIFALFLALIIFFRVIITQFSGMNFLLGLLILSIPCQTYFYDTWLLPLASQNIYNQQYQMHRFVDSYYKKDFAVNDIGLVSYQLNPSIYVLDLYGLASNEALLQPHKNAAWLDSITQKHHVGLVMIYRDWFQGIPKNWTQVATLWLLGSDISPAYNNVIFYATPEGDLREIREELKAFAPGLPLNAWLQIAE